MLPTPCDSDSEPGPTPRRWLGVERSLLVRPPRLAATALLLLLPLTLLAACGDDDDDDVTVEDDVEEVVDEGVDDEEPMADPADGEPAEDGEAMLQLFRDTRDECDAHAEETGNPPVDPARFDDAMWELDPTTGVISIVDGAGTSLLVDLDAGIITGPDGPEGEMPLPYSFACPEDPYVGTVS